jgi:rfaE bifunctional protein nucleotidyltransferase chain/domain
MLEPDYRKANRFAYRRQGLALQLKKIRSQAETDAWVNEQRAAGWRIGFTCGAFDLLHAGHVQYLAAAREKCDRLLVAVNSDESIQRYKSALRPINPWDQRALVVASLESVDCVANLDEDRPRELIERWLPDFYIKGGDYRTGSLRSGETVAKYGGETVFIPVEYESSTSRVIEYVQALEKHGVPAGFNSVEPTGLVLLDRDGTLVRDAIFDPKSIELLNGVLEGLKALYAAGVRLCLVTNQQGIGYGYFGYRDFVDANRALLRVLGAAGILISKIYFCPHSLADRCECRKPGAALLRRAMLEQRVDPERTFLIGDTETDMRAATLAGCHGLNVGEQHRDYPGLTFSEAVRSVLQSLSEHAPVYQANGFVGDDV